MYFQGDIKETLPVNVLKKYFSYYMKPTFFPYVQVSRFKQELISRIRSSGYLPDWNKWTGNSRFQHILFLNVQSGC